MSSERYTQLIGELCEAIGLPDVAAVLASRRIEVEGFDVLLDHLDTDPEALYLQFDYGTVTSGRTLRVFRLMLESNLLIYAQDQAQLGLHPDTGGAMLIVRVPMTEGVDGPWLVDTLVHYAEHGRYWRDNMQQSSDEMFEGLSAGQYHWLRA